MPSKTRIGLMGGCFSPPHFGHLELAELALCTGEVDNIWFVPCYYHAFDKSPIAYDHRVEMCRLMIGCKQNYSVCEDEGIIKSRYSVEILEYITDKYPNFEFRGILGSDNYWKRDKWKEFDKVSQLAPPIWINRPGQKKVPGAMFSCVKDISSTMVREALKNNVDVGNLIDMVVYDYIVEKELYK